MRLFDHFDKAALFEPDAIATVHEGRTMTFAELADLSHRIAAALLAQGLVSGAKVATLLPNHPLFFACQLGIHRTPQVWLPLNARATLVENLDLLRDFDARWLFIHADWVEAFTALRDTLPALQGVVVVGDAPAQPGLLPLETWMAPESVRVPDLDVALDTPVTLMSTGGSTGKSKGVLRTSLGWSTMIANYRAALPYAEQPINLVVAPLSHAGGDVALGVLAQGGTQVILPTADPGLILQAIEEHRATTLFLPPTVVYALLSHPDRHRYDYSSLRYLMYGAAPMSVQKLQEAIELFGPVLTQLYGLTEATSTVSIMSPREHMLALAARPERLASCGRGSPFVAVRVRGADGSFAPVGQKGEVVCRGNTLMVGYDANPTATAQAFSEGWFLTGDIGYTDAQGYVYLVDRKKDMIISGGFNVYPGEVEQVIWTHPGVKDCAVIGVPDAKWGEAVTAIVELQPGACVEADTLIALCKSKLGSVRAPKQVHFWTSLPRSPVGKVLKKTIREEFWKNESRAI